MPQYACGIGSLLQEVKLWSSGLRDKCLYSLSYLDGITFSPYYNNVHLCRQFFPSWNHRMESFFSPFVFLLPHESSGAGWNKHYALSEDISVFSCLSLFNRGGKSTHFWTAWLLPSKTHPSQSSFAFRFPVNQWDYLCTFLAGHACAPLLPEARMLSKLSTLLGSRHL